VDPDVVARLALSWVHREFPNQSPLSLRSASDLAMPRDVTPAFYGSYDWHSSVHAHWTLARIARLYPTCASAPLARAALSQTLTAANVAREVENLSRRPTFERPYGLGWLLTLDQELGEWDDADAARWAETLDGLAHVAGATLSAYFAKLTHPVRTGEHAQTAFPMGLAIDWARSTGESAIERALVERAIAFHGTDRDAPLHREPSGADFLSPSLAEADLVRRVLAPSDLARWLDGFLPADVALVPAVSSDRRDGRLAHLDGLNLSRAWMLDGIASGLPEEDARRPSLRALAREHAAAGMTALVSDEVALTHWIGSFATYAVTKRGLPQGAR
jgi:hypothetical protein